MLKVFVFAAAMVLLQGRDAAAQGKLIFGQGINSCGSWTDSRPRRNLNAGLSAQWVAGYLSGLNINSKLPDALEGTDFDGIMAWIDNYCRSSPLESIGTAAGKLMEELELRRRQRDSETPHSR
jgi:hypothetical protein